MLTSTDGVFAFIITILVLDIRLPEGLGEQSLRDALEEVGPTLVAWIISFLITGTYWVWHRDVLAGVRSVDREVVRLNLLFLVPVGVIPFAASLLGEHGREPLALRVFGAVLVAAGPMRVVLFRYLAARPQLLRAPMSSAGSRLGTGVAVAPVPLYVAAMLVADVAPAVSLTLYWLMPLLCSIGNTVLRRRSHDRADADDCS